MTDLSVKIAGVTLQNPVITASGTFGFGHEYSEFYPLSKLGGISCKGITLEERTGNPSPRIAETPSGMLNAVGLQNPGVDHFIEKDLPWLKQQGTAIIANIAGNTPEEYCAMAEKLSDSDVDLIEMNISCPNVKEGGVTFGTDPHMVEKVVSAVKKCTRQPLIVKLTPNVTDITEIAKAAEAAGADALSLINTLYGMRIDIYRRKPVLANKMGGFSGPAVKPVAVRMVYQVCRAVKVPVLGMGGIMNGEDAVEFIMAGASAVAVGTANLVDPKAPVRILREMEQTLEKMGVADLKDIRGAIE